VACFVDLKIKYLSEDNIIPKYLKNDLKKREMKLSTSDVSKDYDLANKIQKFLKSYEDDDED